MSFDEALEAALREDAYLVDHYKSGDPSVVGFLVGVAIAITRLGNSNAPLPEWDVMRAKARNALAHAVSSPIASN